jgi:prepilin-type N-terminal cleavage/methylation domain-containing protein
MLKQRAAALRRQAQGDESGFSLIEVVVAMVVLLIFAGALSVTLLDGLQVSKSSRQRVAAANLAARELEIVRNKFSSSDAAALAIAATSSVTDPNPLVGVGASNVDGTPYTVRRDVQWLPTGTGVSACDGGALVNSPSLQVFVTVTWPNMRSTQPVTAETVMTPLKGTTDTLVSAYIAVKIQNGDGTAAENVVATAAGPSGSYVHTSDGSGCVVFQVGATGTYTVTLNMAGWVDQTGTQLSVKTPVGAVIGTLVTKTMTYDSAASMNVTLGTDAGYNLPTTVPAINYIKLDAIASPVRQTVASATPTTLVTGLWPKIDGYAAWPGGCPDSDPAAAPTTGGNRGVPVLIPAGGTLPVTAKLAPINLTVVSKVLLISTPVPGVLVTATNASTGALLCSSADKTLTLGTTDATGKLKTSLPYGNWALNTKWNGNLITPGTGAVNALPDPVTPLGGNNVVTVETFQVN